MGTHLGYPHQLRTSRSLPWTPGQPINFSFNFHAMNTGNQASGKWRTQANQQWKTMMRSLVHILQHRYTHHGIHWEHIKAHTNHPYNEFADRLAKFASQHPEEVDGCDTWQQWMTDENHLSALQWIWFLESCQNADARDVPELDGHLLRHQLIVPASCSLPQTTDNLPPQPCSTIDISFVIATANVLTLAEGPQRATPQLTRQQLLMEQCHTVTARCHIVALQETRHKRLIDRGNEFYHIIVHPATNDGRDGVHCPSSQELVTYLIVKLQMPKWRCIIVTGRAPHSGRPAHEGEVFWEHIARKLCPYRYDWPIFFAGDTNGHVGNIITEAIGDYGGTQENAPGACFHRWLSEHHLKLPYTFAEHHDGDQHATYISPDGQHETRIDYIAVPNDSVYTKLCSTIDFDIDLSINRIDHLVAKCDILSLFSAQSHCKTLLSVLASNTIDKTLPKRCVKNMSKHSLLINTRCHHGPLILTFLQKY